MNEQQREQQARTGLFKAGTVAVWVWVAVTAFPILICLGCCAFGIVGQATGAGSGNIR